MSWYPKAEKVPWKYPSADNRPTYYKGLNQPVAVVLHTMQGHASTAREWAKRGQFPKSWHFTVGKNGHVMQHLDFQDGGYHAGITDTQANSHPPTWSLWKGLGINVNWYTIGIEHEGFVNDVLLQYPLQRRASLELCQWLSQELSIPLDETHFPPHAAIDVVNRVNDFDTPARRAQWYAYLTEDEMTPEERARLERVERLLGGYGVDYLNPDTNTIERLTGEAALAYLDASVNYSVPLSIGSLNASLTAHKANHPTGGISPGTTFTAEIKEN